MPITLRHNQTTTTTHAHTPTSASSPTSNLLSHILIQTDQGRLSDASIRNNRIVTVVDRTSHASYYHHLGSNYNDNYEDDHGCTWRRCTFQPMLYALLLVVLVTCSLVAIVRGEAMQAAFPLVVTTTTTTVEEGKWRNPKSGDGDGGGNSTQDDNRMGKGEERLGNGVLSDERDERNGTAVLDDDDDDGALSYLVDEYNEDEKDMSFGGKEGPTVEEDEDGIESTLSPGEESLNSISMVDSNNLTNDTIIAEDVGPSESLVVTHTDNSTTNASNTSLLTTLSTNATSNTTVENSNTPLVPMSTIAIPTDESENLDKPLG